MQSEKIKYVLAAVLAVSLVIAIFFAVDAGRSYYAAVELAKTMQPAPTPDDGGDYVPEPERPLSQYEHLLNDDSREVSEEYAFDFFDDAVFVGDSRTEGLFLYSEITQKTQAVSYAWRGFTTTDALETKKFNVNGKYVTAADALRQNRDFSKVYIMLGVNELSPGGAEEFIERYDKIVSAALDSNPSALIIIQSIIPVTAEKSKGSNYVNNTNAAEFNDALYEYAQQNGYIWLDVAQLMSDGQGNLNPDYDVGDGIHLTQDACQVWFNYLCYYTYL